MTTKVEKTIQVDAPLSTVYNQWTQFEDFPQFMGGVQSVTQIDDRTLHWVAEIGGVKREWDATILEQVPDQKIAWAATEGATNAGAVYFEPIGAGQTMIRLSLEHEPEGLVENVGDKLNIVEKRAEADLEKFKSFIESESYATGAWRGSINEGATVGTPGVESAQTTEGDSGKAGISGKAVAAGAAVAAAGVAAAAAIKSSSGSSETDTEANVDADIQPQSEATVVEVGDVVDVTPVDVEETTTTYTTTSSGDETMR